METLWLALKFIERDIKFKKLIAALTILAIASGVATFVSLRIVSLGSRMSAAQLIEGFVPGEVLVYGKGIYDVSEDVIDDLAKIPGVERVTPAILVTGYLGDTSVFMLGVRPEDIGNVVTGFKEGRPFESDNGPFLVADVGLAKDLNLTVGQTVYLKASFEQGFHEFKVIGIAEVSMKIQEIGTVGGYVIVPLHEAQKMLGRIGYVSMAVVKVKPEQDPALVKTLISTVYPESRVFLREEVIGIVYKIMSLIEGLLLATTMVGLAVAIFGTTSTIMSTVREHQREIAIMRANGASRGDIATIFMLEAFVLGMAGGIIGILFGIAGAKVGIEIIASYGFIQPPLIIEAGSILLGIFLAAVVSTVSAVYPVMKATSVRPVQVLKNE
ncbi:MAG: hypothetical protein DRJ35_01675 [Thermoprotei archaeon]|nr:MAG: hypothetical protein DRJ35_01675 [Thermoprotei archaeon]